MSNAQFLGRLRAAARMAIVAAAPGCVGLTVYAGVRKGSPPLLLGIFALWVFSPFVALVLAAVVSKRWSATMQATLYSVALVLTLTSLAVYGAVALGAPTPRTAVFVVVPPASWLLMAVVLPVALLASRRARR